MVLTKLDQRLLRSRNPDGHPTAHDLPPRAAQILLDS